LTAYSLGLFDIELNCPLKLCGNIISCVLIIQTVFLVF
jgi:hypothetical protein